MDLLQMGDRRNGRLVGFGSWELCGGWLTPIALRTALRGMPWYPDVGARGRGGLCFTRDKV
jgi:hypothetical protein